MQVKPLLFSVAKFIFLPLLVLYVCLRLWVEFQQPSHNMPGKLEVIDGHNIHIVCKGSGAPTIFFETGFGSDAFTQWERISQQLSSTYKSCYYDRLGTGWSDSLPSFYSTTKKAELLTKVMKRVAQGDDVILVAHSYGGILARKAISEHQTQVKKLILVDSAHENQHNRLHPYFKPIPNLAYYGVLANALTGFSKIKNLLSGKQADRQIDYYSSFDYAGVIKNYIDEGGFFTPLEQQNYQLNDMPILILEHDPNAYPNIERYNKGNLIWKELQSELMTLSKNANKHMVVGATHNIPGDQADLLIKHILDFVQQTEF